MILIVDDNKKYIERLVDLLEEAGNTNPIRIANNYKMAVEILASEKPGIILLDMNMPGKSGIEVLRYIKEVALNCRVIMVTNHSNESYRKLCLDEGADHFLDKSRDFGLIPGLIGEMIL